MSGAPPDEEVTRLRAEVAALQAEAAAAREALAQARDEAAALGAALALSHRELDQLAYASSHDLRAPLRGITNLVAWIEEDLGAGAPASVRDQIQLLKGRAARMDRLLSGVLELVRIGRVRQRPERVDVTALLQDTIDRLDPRAPARVMVVGAMPTLVAERAALERVFSELIANALQHAARPDVTVRVTCRDAADEVELTVADDGIGIPAEHHDAVWSLFQTLQHRDVLDTTGVGLTIVRKHVEASGGRAWIDADARPGAAVRFTWPRLPR